MVIESGYNGCSIFSGSGHQIATKNNPLSAMYVTVSMTDYIEKERERETLYLIYIMYTILLVCNLVIIINDQSPIQ